MMHSAHVSGYLGKSIFRLAPNLEVIFFFNPKHGLDHLPPVTDL